MQNPVYWIIKKQVFCKRNVLQFSSTKPELKKCNDYTSKWFFYDTNYQLSVFNPFRNVYQYYNIILYTGCSTKNFLSQYFIQNGILREFEIQVDFWFKVTLLLLLHLPPLVTSNGTILLKLLWHDFKSLNVNKIRRNNFKYDNEIQKMYITIVFYFVQLRMRFKRAFIKYITYHKLMSGCTIAWKQLECK